MSISVCMATYNGAAYVGEQIRSILDQLGPQDELIVVDDASSDDTVHRVATYPDGRIHLHRNTTNLGYVRTFERALSLARNDVIFLADQDDLWPQGRVSAMVAALEEGSVVAGNLSALDQVTGIRGPFGQRDWRLRAATSRHTWRNLARLAASDMPYFGSAMAMRREALDLALPFPNSVRELHDAWIALIGLTSRSMVHVDDRVVLRRLHESNASGRRRSLGLVLKGRIYFIQMTLDAWTRARRARLKPTTESGDRPTPAT